MHTIDETENNFIGKLFVCSMIKASKKHDEII